MCVAHLSLKRELESFFLPSPAHRVCTFGYGKKQGKLQPPLFSHSLSLLLSSPWPQQGSKHFHARKKVSCV